MKFTQKDLTAKYKDSAILLNHSLVDRQGLDKADVEHIKNVHVEKMKIIEQMEALPPTQMEEIKDLALKVQEFEFTLQRLWGFPEDVRFHEWYTLPHCKCPILDNIDRKGTSYCIIVGDCQLHGGTVAISEEFEASYASEPPKAKQEVIPSELTCTIDDFDEFEALRRFFDEEELSKLRYVDDEEVQLKLVLTVA